MPTLYLIISIFGAWLTLNAHRPHRRRTPWVLASFAAGWAVTEFALHHIAFQVVATVGFVWLGALRAWPGWVGLGVTVASWLGLAVLAYRAHRADLPVESALAAGLGSRALVPASRAGAIEVVRNVPYAPGAGRRHRLDIWRPREPAGDAPVLLQLPGGAWVTGDKRNQARPLLRALAARGWVCLAVNYRLSPRATFPDHLVDVKLAIRWAREHAAEHGGNPSFLAITGGSAGGHLAALAGLTPNDTEYQPGFEAVDTTVHACVPFYGVYDFTNRAGRIGGDGMGGFLERLVMKCRVADDPDAFRRASPVCRVRPDAPPFMIVHGTHDSFAPVEDARTFVDELRVTSRAPVVYLELPDAQHAFDVFATPRTRHVIDGVAQFLQFVRASSAPTAAAE